MPAGISQGPGSSAAGWGRATGSRAVAVGREPACPMRFHARKASSGCRQGGIPPRHHISIGAQQCRRKADILSLRDWHWPPEPLGILQQAGLIRVSQSALAYSYPKEGTPRSSSAAAELYPEHHFCVQPRRKASNNELTAFADLEPALLTAWAGGNTTNKACSMFLLPYSSPWLYRSKDKLLSA